jgi:hypothetical protein
MRKPCFATSLWILLLWLPAIGGNAWGSVALIESVGWIGDAGQGF